MEKIKNSKYKDKPKWDAVSGFDGTGDRKVITIAQEKQTWGWLAVV